MRVLRHLMIVLVCSCFTASQVLAVGASGFSTQYVGAKASGQGNAFVAQADDPSALYFNPAGMTQLSGTQLSIGSSLLLPFTERSGAGVPEDKMKREVGWIPNFYLTGSLPVSMPSMDDKVAVGVGLTSPYGLTTKWAPNSSVRYVTTTSKFQMVNVNPSIAAKVLPSLSVGVGADYVNLINSEAQNRTNQAAANADDSPDGNSKLSGHGSGWGYNVGVLYKPLEKHSFGASYRSQVKIPIKGSVELTDLSPSSQANYSFSDSNYSADAQSSIILPASFIAGYTFRPTEKWTFSADYEWTQWNVFQHQDVSINDSDPSHLAFLTGNPASNSTRVERNWRNVSAIGLGANYKMDDKWQWRGGYGFFEKTVPNDTFSPDIPDAPIHLLTVGLSHAFTPQLGLDLAFNEWLYASRSVNNTVGNSVGASVNGTYKTHVPVISLNLTYLWSTK